MKLFEPRGSQLIRRDRHFPGRAPIDAYGDGGFRFAEMSHRGSILCLPSGIHGWEAAGPQDLTVAGLERAIAEANDFDVLLIGAGRDIVGLPQDLRYALKERGVRVDVMPTGSAIRTYNIMLGENRTVAAALIAVD